MKKITLLIYTILIILLFTGFVYAQEIEETSYSDELIFDDNDFEISPAFMQKGGMMHLGEHSLYLRTNDEWTGFSTFYIGYRYGVSEFFNIGFEIAASPIPHVYLIGLQLNFKFYESPNKLFFFGLRTRTGYKFQDSDFSSWGEGWQDYLTLKRNGIYLALDFTVALRFGKDRQFSLYYTIYPRFDFDFVDTENPVYFLFSPIMLGFEVRFGKEQRWSFAIEAGYTFPLPWDSIEPGKWVNFPSLANMGLYYRW